MRIFVNGKANDFDEGTIEKLIQRHGLPPEATLVEHNGSALRRREWATKKLQENDRVEILCVAAGG
jgi:thiamine biosynthesis protein ThiS